MIKKDSLIFKKRYAFDHWDERTTFLAFNFAQGYKRFLSNCKTERRVINWTAKEAEQKGFKKLGNIGGFSERPNLLENRRFYNINRGKSIMMARFGKRKITDGLRIVMAHADSPRIDLKSQPLYEKEHLAFFKTHYYGGIKKYQWPTLPLALYGVIVKQDGTAVDVEIGEREGDPIFMISDLLPHLAEKQLEKNLKDAVDAEELNLIIGSMSDSAAKKKGKIKVKKNLLKILNNKYDITEEDLVSADLELVPTGPARDLGFDASLISAYGQDDRICSYTAIQALFDAEDPEYTSLVVLVDREEIGSDGATGATSNFIVDFIGELLHLEHGQYNENYLRDILTASKAISADVTAGFDPDYPDVFDEYNAARLGAGIAVEKYTGRKGKAHTSEATAEYLAYIRKIYNEADVYWQTGGLGKVDIGGGGTIAMYLSRYNIDVIDSGPALLSMHAPFEVSSKADVYSAYLAYRAFLKSH